MIEPTREQLAKIDQLAGIYDSVECVPTTERPAPDSERGQRFYDFRVTCWEYRTSGAKIVAHALTIHPDGTESDRR